MTSEVTKKNFRSFGQDLTDCQLLLIFTSVKSDEKRLATSQILTDWHEIFFCRPLRSYGSTWWYLQLSCALLKNFLIFHYFFNSAQTFQIQSKGTPSTSNDLRGHQKKFQVIRSRFDRLPIAFDFYQCKIR